MRMIAVVSTSADQVISKIGEANGALGVLIRAGCAPCILQAWRRLRA